MSQRLRYLCWAMRYVFATKVLRREIPFIGGLVLNDSCNLQCEQCRVANQGRPDLTFDQAEQGLQQFREMGIRSIAITGGEPFHWADGDYRLEQVVERARNLGFLAVTIYTNGTYPIETTADTVLVGLDGLESTTKHLRADIYDRVLDNIRRSDHPNIHINFSINAKNAGEIQPFLEAMRAEPNVGGVFFFFHTPYYGIDELFLDLERRRELARQLLQLKQQGYAVLNSRGALKAYLADRWPRPSKVCYTYAYGKMFPCCRENANPQACEHCGYLGYLEVIEIVRLHPSAIWAGFNYLSRRKAS